MDLAQAKQLHKEGKREEAYSLYRELFTQKPTSADFFTSFGTLLLDIGELDMAEKIAAMATKCPDRTSESWILCGAIYVSLGNYPVARAVLEAGLKLDPDHKKLHEDLGLIIKNEFYDYRTALDHLQKAEQNARVLGNIGLCYRGINEEEKAEKYFVKAIKKDKFFTPTYTYYINYLLDQKDYKAWYKLVDEIYDEQFKDWPPMLILMTGKAMCLYLEDRVKEAVGVVEGQVFYSESNWMQFEYTSVAIMMAYRRYLVGLLEYWQKHQELYSGSVTEEIHVVGDSHTLSYAWLNVEGKRVVPHLVMGCKMRHIVISMENRYRRVFRRELLSLPDGAKVICNLGEIDCRDHGGFATDLIDNPKLDLKAHVKQHVKDYIKFIKAIAKEKNLNVTIAGIHAPKGEECKYAAGSKERLLRFKVIETINKELSVAAKNAGMNFFTTYKPNKEGLSPDDWFVDVGHLRPDLYVPFIKEL